MENKDSLYAVFDERNRAAEMAGTPRVPAGVW